MVPRATAAAAHLRRARVTNRIVAAAMTTEISGRLSRKRRKGSCVPGAAASASAQADSSANWPVLVRTNSQ
jgi:hypothetical protein